MALITSLISSYYWSHILKLTMSDMQILMDRKTMVHRRKYADRKHRKPQRPFSVDSVGKEHDKKDNNWNYDNNIRLDMPLTTNKPREVEMINPKSGIRERLFESCSAAARSTNINRTKMSRSKFLYFYFIF